MNAFIESMLQRNYDEKLHKSSSSRRRTKSKEQILPIQDTRSTISTATGLRVLLELTQQALPRVSSSSRESTKSKTSRIRRARSIPSTIICFILEGNLFSTRSIHDIAEDSDEEETNDERRSNSRNGSSLVSPSENSITFVPEQSDFNMPREMPVNFSEVEEDSSSSMTPAADMLTPLLKEKEEPRQPQILPVEQSTPTTIVERSGVGRNVRTHRHILSLRPSIESEETNKQTIY